MPTLSDTQATPYRRAHTFSSTFCALMESTSGGCDGYAYACMRSGYLANKCVIFLFGAVITVFVFEYFVFLTTKPVDTVVGLDY